VGQVQGTTRGTDDARRGVAGAFQVARKSRRRPLALNNASAFRHDIVSPETARA